MKVSSVSSVSPSAVPLSQDSCTTILIGAAATRDGSRIIARTEDHDPLLSKVLLKHPPQADQRGRFHANENAFSWPLPQRRRVIAHLPTVSPEKRRRR